VIRLESVAYRYAGASRASIREIDLELPDGQVVGLAGASESGKSTLCLVVAGLAPRAIRGTLAGRMLIDGADVARLPMHELARMVGIGFQHPSTQLSGVTDTVYEEIAFGPANLGVPRDELMGRVEDAMARLAIADLASRDPARLSGGQMQLVAIAGLLAMRPRHLVLDEPTAQLDPAGTTLVADALASLASDGASILVAEQKTDLLARVAGRVVVLDGGVVALEGPSAIVLDDPRLEGLGVPRPSGVRLRRAMADAGLDARMLEGLGP
jgi:energy-coupling factor transporter ATP-binding protein EcfA2